MVLCPKGGSWRWDEVSTRAVVPSSILILLTADVVLTKLLLRGDWKEAKSDVKMVLTANGYYMI